MKKLFVIATIALLFVGVSSLAQAQGIVKSDTAKWAEKHFKFVGDKACKTCHKVEHESWLASKHANAWALLKAEEQAKPECASCHSTGKTAADSLLTGVGCESCHGPGSEYKSMKNMKDHALFAAAGGLPVNEKTCAQCHNKNSPTFKEINFTEAIKAGVHKVKPKTPAK